jgi:succinoglycan biosynthesis transport protein ExoP
MERFAASDGSHGGEDAAELRRYSEALKRSRVLIVAIVVPLTLTVLVVSLLLPKTYRASVTMVLGGAGMSAPGANPELVTRDLTTAAELATTSAVLTRAARDLHLSSPKTLAAKVKASTPGTANLVRITAEDDDPIAAARIANAVADAFAVVRLAQERRASDAARAALLDRIARLREVGGREGEIAALRDGLRVVATSDATVAEELTVAERARPPEKPASPRVVQNTLFAFFGFAFVAALAALARDQIAPRIRSAGELANLLTAPVLMELPARRATESRPPADVAPYELLRESLHALLPASGVRAVVVASLQRHPAAHNVAHELAAALARANERTLFVDGATDSVEPGESATVSELLDALGSSDDGVSELLVRAQRQENLACFAYKNVARLAASIRVDGLLEGLSDENVSFAVLVGPPLNSESGLVLPHAVGRLLLVCQPQRLTSDDARRLRELLSATGAELVGIVSIGGRQVVPYQLVDHEQALEVRPSARASRRENGGSGSASRRTRRKPAVR